MEMQELRTEEDSLETEAGRQLVGSAGGTLTFWLWESNLHAKVLKSLTFVVFNLLGTRGCSLGKINLAIVLALCKVGLLFAGYPRPVLRVLLPP